MAGSSTAERPATPPGGLLLRPAARVLPRRRAHPARCRASSGARCRRRTCPAATLVGFRCATDREAFSIASSATPRGTGCRRCAGPTRCPPTRRTRCAPRRTRSRSAAPSRSRTPPSARPTPAAATSASPTTCSSRRRPARCTRGGGKGAALRLGRAGARRRDRARRAARRARRARRLAARRARLPRRRRARRRGIARRSRSVAPMRANRSYRLLHTRSNRRPAAWTRRGSTTSRSSRSPPARSSCSGICPRRRPPGTRAGCARSWPASTTRSSSSAGPAPSRRRRATQRSGRPLNARPAPSPIITRPPVPPIAARRGRERRARRGPRPRAAPRGCRRAGRSRRRSPRA